MSVEAVQEPKSSSQSRQSPVQVLAVGLSTPVESLLGVESAKCKIVNQECNLEKLMEPFDPPPEVIVCAYPPEGISPSEVAQSLRMQYPEAPIYCVCTNRAGFDRKIFVKNGFSDAFLLPLDLDFLKKTLAEDVVKISGSGRTYRSVKLIDIKAGETLEFDTSIYLPANNKYIRYTAAGDPLDEERVSRLAQHKMSSLYVPKEQMPKFYSYTAKHLKDIGSSETMSETEKKEKLETSIRELMTGIFNSTTKDGSFEQGKALVKDCQQIVKNYVMTKKPGGKSNDWYSKLLVTIGELGGSYSNAANVSTYASLFSIGLQIGNPADLAMAGLLQDIGLADVPQEIVLKPESERTSDEKALYQKHPNHSVGIIKARRLVVPEAVLKAIAQHHENYNGTGYPEGLVGNRICKEAQILALADRFNTMTTASEGRALMSPPEAVKHFKNQLASDPSQMFCDPELLSRVLRLFPEGS